MPGVQFLWLRWRCESLGLSGSLHVILRPKFASPLFQLTPPPHPGANVFQTESAGSHESWRRGWEGRRASASVPPPSPTPLNSLPTAAMPS